MARVQIPKPCLDCRELSGNTRCRTHGGAPHPTNPAYRDPAYRRTRNQMIRDHVATHGWTCPGAPERGHLPHPSFDLTADHIISVSEDGTNDRANLRVLCRPENIAKGGSTRQ